MRKLIAAIIISIILISVGISPVYAIADPTSIEVNNVYVYELDDGGLGMMMDYDIQYAALPDETVTNAYYVAFIDIDGTTQLKSVAPYTYLDTDNRGYGKGVAWIEFTATEVATYSLDKADEAIYTIWLTGNPLLGWTGDPPKVIANIDEWNDTGDPAVLIALQVLDYATDLEEAWDEDMIQTTAVGNRLTSNGEAYFTNVIDGLRDLAPGCFSNAVIQPTWEEEGGALDYSTEFGGTFTDGTGVATGSPITLTEGTNNITITTAGTFIIELLSGTSGNVTSGNVTVSGSPVIIKSGTNTITCTTESGYITIYVVLVNTTTNFWGYIQGTGFDLTDAASSFGMTRGMFSGAIWFFITIIILVAVNRVRTANDIGSGGRITMIVFTTCIIGGYVLGLMPMIPLAILMVADAIFAWYVFFHSQSTY